MSYVLLGAVCNPCHILSASASRYGSSGSVMYTCTMLLSGVFFFFFFYSQPVRDHTQKWASRKIKKSNEGLSY